MKAALLHRYGGNEGVRLGDVPEPDVGEGDLLIETSTAGVLPVDVKMRKGVVRLLLPARFPQAMGMEVAGTVARVGSRVTRFKAGDEVYGLLWRHRLGAFAERCVLRESDAALKPARLSFEEAVALPVAGLTALQALTGVADVRPGQKVFVNAGSGGTGTVTIQIAKAMGAFVAASTSTGNVELVRSLGADRVVDYKREEFHRVLTGFDVVVDLVGGPHIERGFDVLARGGHLVSLADAPDAAFARAFGLNPFVQLACRFISRRETRRARQTGTHYAFFLVQPSGEQLTTVTELADTGKLAPVIDSVFTLDRISDALAHVEKGRSRGKVVLRVS